MPWTVIATPEEADGFADQLARTPPRRAIWTSIAGALDFSVELLAGSAFEATRRVIDVSGDGSNNQGREITRARDDAIAKGIMIFDQEELALHRAVRETQSRCAVAVVEEASGAPTIRRADDALINRAESRQRRIARRWPARTITTGSDETSKRR